MKLAVAVTLICLSCALASTSVCLPPQFNFERSGEFNGFVNHNGGWANIQEYYDYTGQRFHSINQVFTSNNTEFRDEVIILAPINTAYFIRSQQGGGSVNCTKQTGTFTVPSPCLLNNATQQQPIFIAGDVLANVYFESGWDPVRKAQYYAELSLSAGNNAPVARRVFVNGTGSFFDLYYNFNVGNPNYAFLVPAFCPSVSSGSLTDAETDDLIHRTFGAIPRVSQ